MSVPRLAIAALGAASPRVGALRYDPQRCSIGIVHLGVGNFHRAHQAVHVDAALANGQFDWAISGWSLRREAVPVALTPQDGIYSLLIRDSARTEARLLAPIREVHHAPSTPDRLIERMASPATRIITLTITEKAYGLGPDGRPDLADPSVAADLAGGRPPKSALGWLSAGLAARRAQAPAARITLASCDNLSANGDSLRMGLDAFVRASSDPALADWIMQAASFPNSMVDRIVPATTAADRELSRSLTGFADAWPVATEPFSQWVVEDRFLAGRPEFEASGVQFTADVRDWEQMKLRLLNAAHSAIAYFGVVAGWKTVDEAIRQPALKDFLVRFWREEAIPTLPASIRAQAHGYCEALLIRFDNTALAHKTIQIAADGSKKLPLRWLPTLRARRAAGASFDCLALAFAAWLHALAGRDESGTRLVLDDPRIDKLAPLASEHDTLQVARGVFAEEPGLSDLCAHDAVLEPVAKWLARLRARGVRSCLAEATARL